MKTVIFGTGALAEVCHYYLACVDRRDVVGFCLDDAYLQDAEFMGLPVHPWSAVAERCPPEGHEMFVAVGYADGNRYRQTKCMQARALGYRLAGYIDPSVANNGAHVGHNCLVGEQGALGPFSRLGDGVLCRSGCLVGHHARLGDWSYLGGGVVVSGFCEIGAHCFIGSGAVLRDGVKIAPHCVVGMGALVTRDLDVPGVYVGAPARLLREGQDERPR